MKTISERGRERPAQDKTKSDIKIGMQVEVCNQTSYFTRYNGQIGIVEEIGISHQKGSSEWRLYRVRLVTDHILLLFRDEIEIVKDDEK